MQNCGLLIKKPYDVRSKHLNSMNIITPSVCIDSHGVTSKYKGFDGEAWPCKALLAEEGIQIPEETGLLALDSLNGVLRAYESFRKKTDCALLYLSYDLAVTFENTSWDTAFAFYGYEYGNYVSEYNYYSCVMHEVIYGQSETLRQYAVKLNENLLFSDLSFLNNYRNDRQDLVRKGVRLETEFPEESYEPIKIWGYRSI